MMLAKLACGLGLLPFRVLIRAHPKGQPGGGRDVSEACYPSYISGLAMVARGEIGFLISSIAESDDIYRGNDELKSKSASDLSLIVSWAIVLCTIISPICAEPFNQKFQNKKASGGLERQDEKLIDQAPRRRQPHDLGSHRPSSR